MKKYKTQFMVVFFLVAVLFSGCSTQDFTKPEQIPKAIEQISKTTEKAINDKDLKLARLLWSQISKYGVKAGETGYKDLGESLGKLAATYVNLVQYLETGDEAQLSIFRQNYDKAIAELEKVATFTTQ